MKKYGLKLLWLLLTVLLAAAWWGWQEGGIQLLQPGIAWC